MSANLAKTDSLPLRSDTPATLDAAGASSRIVPGTRRARGQSRPLFDAPIVRRAIVDSFHKLDPRHQIRNPVMFVV
ncbi:MAG: hypothetical protein M3O50_03205, partial [Myxococcota bacterium]|nr:hypothetical protein [Myxococcota bacterium]